jgi:hypothetical protein
MFEPGEDQAAGLRQLLRLPPLRLLPVTGTGTPRELDELAAGIAGACSLRGCRTLLVGARAPCDAVPGAAGPAVRRVALPSRLQGMSRAGGAAAWIEELPIAHRGFELAVVAAPEGLMGPMFERLRPVTLVSCGPSRDDLAGAYAVVKRLARGHGFQRFQLLFAGLPDPALALRRQRRLAGVALRHLGVEVGFAGAVVLEMQPSRHEPGSAAAAAGSGADALVPVADAARSWSLAAVGRGGAALH